MKIVLSILLIIQSLAIFGQEVIGSSGGTMNDGSVSLDFTLGETVILTVSDGNNDLTQGFHQTNWQFVGMQEYMIGFEANLYPNPTSEELILNVEKFDQITYQLYNVYGELVRLGQLINSETKIYVADLPSGEYTLSLLTIDSKIQTYQLIKIN